MLGLRRSVLVGALVLVALAPPAHGQSGNGLYEPFVGKNSIERSKDFVAELETADGSALKLSESELEAGVLVDERGKTQPAPSLDRGASDRSAGGDGLGSLLAWVVALGVLAVAAAGVRRLGSGPVPRQT